MSRFYARLAITRWLIALTVALLFALPTIAQPQPGGPGQGGPGGPGGFDPSAFRQRMLDRIKDALGASDEEMQAIGPKIEKVWTLQMQMNMGRMSMFRRSSNNGGPGANAAVAGGGQDGQQTSALVQATRDLQTALDNKDAKPEEIKAKLQAYRDAKSAAKNDLTKAQAELKDLLTQRQEATLVMMGMLD